MSKIIKIETFRVPPRWLFVRVETEDGIVGWGEGTLEGHTEAIEGAFEDLKERFIGWDSNKIEEIWQKAYRQRFYRGGPVLMSALSGLDIALWDIKGKRLGVPIYELLGGKIRDRVQVYGWIGGDKPSNVQSAAQDRKNQGFTAVKMNATESIGWIDSASKLDDTVERIRLVRETGIDAGIDFHGRLHKGMAKQLVKKLEKYEPLFIEEPLLPENYDQFKQLYATTTIPIATGERLYTRWDVKPYLEAGSIDIIQPDIAHSGGITETKKIALLAEAYDVAVAPHCPLGPIALAASFHIDLTSINFSIQEMSLGMHYNKLASGGKFDLLSYVNDPESFDVKNGYIEALNKPGLGIEVNEELIREVSKNEKAWRNPRFVGPDGCIREW
ncbi:D-galactonate dehydratase [Wickerhamomyces ciferrii]|uniref:D-galactonate dehydratase n=1 Tax=Wickerhamomyces ciferrii (strain ATCC 14091 / BCRC 22168 / CBS 111 / JCM 3599 / NBRC 0793 / NRRL Y-1031 F-60-10) TaxID=1206466 RepID=K0KCN4_WICCF|nr:D-galactonate dehydratase [Wickerhamomyces ciferrii]CCH42835.1 D-galactonate dehydratase [Wickerhamomyces ciferrii]